MKKRKLALVLALGLALTGCGNASDSSSDSQSQDQNLQSEQDISQEEVEETPASASTLLPQGNSTSVYLSEIAEDNPDGYNAWLKISTQFDPDLSMYSYDSAPADSVALIVDFSVSGYDLGSSTLYWGYQLISGGDTYSVWDGSSPADTLTITQDGSYRMVFDAATALGGTIETIESFQLVFPCSEDTDTKVTIKQVTAITDSADLQYYTTGAID